jgi:hypothetical protein
VLATISRYLVSCLTDIVSILSCGYSCSAALLALGRDTAAVAAPRKEPSVAALPVRKGLHGEQSQYHSDAVPAR